MVIALAGRRVDAEGSTDRRFPPSNLKRVSDELRSLFERQNATALVCSASAGADLLALGIAEELGLRRRVVLPFLPGPFCEGSVLDRPGDWGERFVRVLKEEGDGVELVVLGLESWMPNAFECANREIINNAEALGQILSQPLLAVVVWDDSSRGPDDAIEGFRQASMADRLSIVEISTI